MSPSLDGGHGVPGSLVGGGFRDDRNRYTMHSSSTAKILRAPITFGGQKVRLTLDGDAMTLDGAMTGRTIVDLAEVTRASYNSTNGLWAFRFRDGRRLWLQSAGGLLSADRSPAGRQSNSLIADRLIHHNVRVFGV
jgi:hypothetical protein